MVTTFAHRTILLWSQTIFPWELVFLVSLQLFHESSFLSNSFSYTLPLFPFMSVVKSSWATDSTSSYGWYTSFDQSHSRTYSLTLPLLGDTLKMKMQELSGILLLSKKASQRETPSLRMHWYIPEAATISADDIIIREIAITAFCFFWSE